MNSRKVEPRCSLGGIVTVPQWLGRKGWGWEGEGGKRGDGGTGDCGNSMRGSGARRQLRRHGPISSFTSLEAGEGQAEGCCASLLAGAGGGRAPPGQQVKTRPLATQALPARLENPF